jgi:hypothetical protein
VEKTADRLGEDSLELYTANSKAIKKLEKV